MLDVFIIVWSFVLVLFIVFYDCRKYKKNTPYTPLKQKRNFFYRIWIGIRVGFHYLHFIGTYNHKKYNTQVFTPKTLECYVGVSFAAIFWGIYFFSTFYLMSLFGNYSLLILLIPTITNIISIFYGKK